ncbi:MAG: hypothetical protein BWK80_13840 [Desulfobacteraceae bacterium IS3]|nr:MAG: hypothetical protein BWK80_13840 [Desulfobacteraceae bacterium IS3]
MPIGSHNDAFKAYQFVKKLSGKEAEPVLARLTADILLDFVRNHRQIDPNFIIKTLPEDRTFYDAEKLDHALNAVESLCGKCNENHDNACFVNQARRILIAAKTGVDLGSDFDGKQSLIQLLEAARIKSCMGQKASDFCLPENIPEQSEPTESYADLKRKYEELREKDVFRATLIEEIVSTIRSVSEGNLEAEMPVHDDPQLGQLATAFNIMLKTINKSMSHLDRLVAERTSELNKSNEALQVSLQREHESNVRLNETLRKVEEANRHITDSIQYAKLIQSSLLPNPENIKTFLPDSFVIWMPRDIVGGDFIFTDHVEGGVIIALVDCTGHGVPGAFMTMIASSGLRKIIRDEGWRDPAQILKRLNFFVKTTLHQDTDYALSDDGLDAGVCFVTGAGSEVRGQGELTGGNREITFAGAKLPLIYVHKGEAHIVKGDRQSVGYRKSDEKFNFTNHMISMEKSMSFYMASDGFADQPGGAKGRRFSTDAFTNLLKNVSVLPFEEQREMLVNAFEEYKGLQERRDDVTVVGFGSEN